MIDFRLALAQEVADQIGAFVQSGRCLKCRAPLMEKVEQGIPFCWFCMTDRMAAQRGRTALTKAKMAANGIFLEEDMHACQSLVESVSPDDRSSWPKGWIL